MRPAVLLACLALAVTPSLAVAAEEVDLELILAVDISGSVDDQEAEEQRQGYVAALRDPAVIDAIAANELGRIAVTYVEWSGPEQQDQVLGWTILDGAEAATGFANRLGNAPRVRGMWTAIGAALDFSRTLFVANGLTATRQVIDVSGDGSSNRGPGAAAARDRAVAAGIVINGLPIMNDRPQPWSMPTPNEMGLDRYYQDNVIGGPGAFIVRAESFEDFRRAILAKLVREIAAVPADRLQDGALLPDLSPSRPAPNLRASAAR